MENMETKNTTNNEAVTENVTTPITIQNLLVAGSQFGHKTSQWNPRMANYLYGSRNDVYIFNLERTLEAWHKAREVIVNTAARGGEILLVGAKRQCSQVIAKEAKRCNSFYVDYKWVGGTLTNLATVKASITKMKKTRDLLEKLEQESPSRFKITKKEKLGKKRELDKLEQQFGGIEDMKNPPQLMFVVDVNHHLNAVLEARVKGIPVVALVDSNADPSLVDYVIPANDDANGSLALFITNVADAILEGKEVFEMNKLSNIEKELMEAELSEEGEALIEATGKREKAVPREKRKPSRRVDKRQRKAYPAKRVIADGITVFTEDSFEKEAK
jgi:small subunit ribosomal protein S2